MAWSFIVPRPIAFGEGALETVGKRVAQHGARASVITGRSAMRRSGVLDRVIASLADAAVDARAFEEVPPEPTLDAVDAATAFTRSAAADVVIGLGGGSVMDVAKVAAFLAPTALSVRALYEGAPVDRKGLPYIAVPTTAGSGSEVTPNAVFTDPETQIKSSVRGEALYADLVICDPEVTVTAPPHVTAYAGMDAFTQAVEAYVSKGATALTDAMAREAAVRVAQNIRAAYADGVNLEARTEILLGSMMAGMALANARSGAVHGMAHPVGSRYRLAHGLVCAMLLPHVIRFNSDPVYDRAAVTVAKYGSRITQRIIDFGKRFHYGCTVGPLCGYRPAELSRCCGKRLNEPAVLQHPQHFSIDQHGAAPFGSELSRDTGRDSGVPHDFPMFASEVDGEQEH